MFTAAYCLLVGAKTRIIKDYDIDLSVRYSQINASENVTMLGVYLGCGTNMSFFKAKKSDNINFSDKQTGKADK